MKTKLLYIFFGLFLIMGQLSAQITDSLAIQDSSVVVNDSISIDSISLHSSSISLSKDSLDAPVQYTAQDSMVWDIENRKVHLYGNAKVDYTTISLKANYIVFDWGNNEVVAEAYPDSSGTLAGFPNFKDGDQDFDSKKMRFNFKTKKGIVYDVTTEQQSVIVHGEKSKFAREQINDSTHVDVIYSKDAIFTTCTADHPHFGIRSKRQKIVPNKVVVVGPSNLEIMDIPTPIWLPFGVFPLTNTRTTGLLFPQDYGYQPNLGMGFSGLGWFFPLGDHVNLALRSRLYWNGTFGVNATTTYVKKYKFRGDFFAEYGRTLTEQSDGSNLAQNGYILRWSHKQDANAHPTITIGGSIDFQIGDYNRTVSNRPEDNIERTLTSNFSFTKKWREKPYSFTASFNHRQSTATRNIRVDLPLLNFRSGTIYPFKRKIPVGGRKWYEDINFNYTAEAKNTFEGVDTTFFTQKTLEEAKYGVKQNLNAQTSIKVLKYFNLNPSVRWNETSYFSSIDKNFEEDLIIQSIQNADGTVTMDTIKYGNIISDKVTGLKSFRQINAGLNLSTQVFNTLQFKGKRKLGIRHTIKPNVGFSYSPDYTRTNWFDEVQDSTSSRILRYSHFEQGIYGQPSYVGKRMALTYNFNNIFEAKYFSTRDTIDKKFKLFNNIRVSGDYNFAADSLHWSRVRMSGNQPMFKGMTTLNISATWDPYYNQLNESGTSAKRTSQFYWDTHGKILQFLGMDISANSTMNVSKFRELFLGGQEKIDTGNDKRGNLLDDQEEAFISLLRSFTLRHNINTKWERTETGKDTLFISTHSINFNGSMQLTDAWNINIGNIGYNFIQKQITYPYITFIRDLHCWEMSFSWAPQNNSYNFSIYAKRGAFDFLKAPYRRLPQQGVDPFR